MQKFIFIGNLTRDPDLSENNNGVKVCRFTVAVNRPYAESNGERQADFFNCTAWKGLANSIARYCRKGSKIFVAGSIQHRTYEDNRGNKRDTIDVIVQEAEFLDPPKKDDGGEVPMSNPQTRTPQARQLGIDGIGAPDIDDVL